MVKIGYRKRYRLNIAVPGRKSIKITFPYEVVEREARLRGLTVEEFLDTYQASAEYNNFDGVIYRFEEIPREDNDNGNNTNQQEEQIEDSSN